jgi:large subunit ribosomal protein L10
MKEEKITTVPENKKQLVKELAEKIRSSKTILLASTKGLPSSQFQKIKKGLRGKADITVAKRTLVIKAIESVEKGALQNLKAHLGADIALMFSEMDPFDLSALLVEKQSPTKAKAGSVAPEDIVVEPGPTDLVPGPAISELSSVGLKVSVESGKLAIKQKATIVKEGEIINEKVAGVLAKLNITPMKVGFIPLAAYDSASDKVYTGIKIDKEGTLISLKEAISRSLGFAVHLGYVCKENIGYLIARAGLEAKALERLSSKVSGKEESK